MVAPIRQAPPPPPPPPPVPLPRLAPLPSPPPPPPPPPPLPPPAPAPASTSQEGVGSFVEGAVAGNFSDNHSWSAIAGQTAVGFIPVVGQIADIRDTAASIGQIARGEDGGWLNLGASLVGFVPGAGDFAKGLIRSGAHVAEGGADVAAATARAAPPPPSALPSAAALPSMAPKSPIQPALATPTQAPIAAPLTKATPAVTNAVTPMIAGTVRTAAATAPAVAPAATGTVRAGTEAAPALGNAASGVANAAPAAGNTAIGAANAAPAVSNAARGADAAGPVSPTGSGAGAEPPSLQRAASNGPNGPTGPTDPGLPNGSAGTPPPRGPTESEGAQLAADAYSKVSVMTAQSGSRFVELSPSELADLGLTQKMMGKSTFFSGGFARAYKAESVDGQAHYVVSFRGTNAASPRDWKSNVLQGLGFSTSHYRQALAIGKQLENVASRESLTMVGHSLGGGRASMAAIASGAKGLTYNAAGLHQKSINVAEAAARDLRSFRPEVRAISTSGDILTRISDTNRMLPEAFGSREMVMQQFAPAAASFRGKVSDAVQGLPGVQGVVAHLNTGVMRSVDAHYGSSVTAFRVDTEGFAPRIAGDGTVPVVGTRKGERALFVNMGQPQRAAEFALGNRSGDATVTAVEVDAKLLETLRQTAVTEDVAKANPNAPIVVDVSKAPDQYGLRTPDQIQMLRDAILAGTVRMIDPNVLRG